MVFKSSNRKKWIWPRQCALRAVALLLSVFLLLACDGPPKQCYEADDFGQTETFKMVVNAKEKFTPSGISLVAGEQLFIEVAGGVELCPTIDRRSASTTIPISPNVSGWQDSGIEVQKDEDFTIKVSGKYTDVNGEQTKGRGLYVLISPNPPTIENDNMWYGQPGPAPDSQRLAETNGQTDYFFELFNNGTDGVGNDSEGGVSGHSPVTGNLYFRYARNAEARGTSSHSSPWRGFYKWQESPCIACMQATINTTCFYSSLACGLVPGGPVACFAACMTAWHLSCEADHKYEYARSDDKHKTSDCQEHGYGALTLNNGDDYWGSYINDHWVNEGYSLNSGPGYAISLSKGCGGHNGKFLQMDIGSSTFTEEFYVAKDCAASQEAGEECEVCPEGSKIFVNGTTNGCFNTKTNAVVMKKVPHVTPNGTGTCSTCSLNSSGVLESGQPMIVPNYFKIGSSTGVKGGVYNQPAPASGELWFEILDTEREKNDAHPEGAFFEDNSGKYVLSITTPAKESPTEVINAIIKPLKRIIQGYCIGLNGPGVYNSENITRDDCESRTFTVLEGDPLAPVTHNRVWRTGITEFMYNILISSHVFIDTVRAVLVLLVIIYAMMFMMGMLKEAHTTVIKKVLKFAIILQLISPGSWQFFNTYLFSVFIDGMDSLIAMIAGGFMNSALGNQITNVTNLDNPFAFADATLTKFLSFGTWAKMLSLFVTSPVGFLYVFLILVGMKYFLVAVIRAAIVYALSMFVIALLLILAPIFITLWMFEFTKEYFNKWIMSLINYLFQPVIVLTALSIFNVFVYSALYTLMHFRICWEHLWGFTIKIPIPAPPWLYEAYLPIFNFYVPNNATLIGGGPLDATGVPMGLFTVLIFLILAKGMMEMVDFMAGMVATITVANKSATLNKAAAGVAASLNPFSNMKMTMKGPKIKKDSWQADLRDGKLGNRMLNSAREAVGMSKKDYNKQK